MTEKKFETLQKQCDGDRIVYFPELRQRYGKSRTTIWRWVKSGWMPAPVKVGPNSVGWWESSLQAFNEKIGGGSHIMAIPDNAK